MLSGGLIPHWLQRDLGMPAGDRAMRDFTEVRRRYQASGFPACEFCLSALGGQPNCAR